MLTQQISSNGWGLMLAIHTPGATKIKKEVPLGFHGSMAESWFYGDNDNGFQSMLDPKTYKDPPNKRLSKKRHR